MQNSSINEMATRLPDMEYAKLEKAVRAMVKKKDTVGNPVYANNKEICDWLDEIREASDSQRFVKEDQI